MKTKTNNYKMENNISYEEYCQIIEEFKKLLTELEFNKESGQSRKHLLDDYVDFMLKYPDYYTRQTEQQQKQADEDISYVVNDAIEKLNERIQSGDCSAERCYSWLTMEKNHYEDFDLVHNC